MNLALVFELDVLRSSVRSGQQPQDSVKKSLYYKREMPALNPSFAISSRVARGYHKSLCTGGRVGEESYFLHISKMKKLISWVLMKRNLSFTLGVGFNLVIIGTRADITSQETIRTLFLEYATVVTAQNS